jgi:immunity protein Imm1 of predicted polymorphic toxin system
MTKATTTVTTVVFPDRPLPESVPLGTSEDVAWPKAYNDEERRDLVREIRSELDGHQRRVCRIYSWDRPCRSMMVYEHDDLTGGYAWISLGEQEFPPQGMWAVAEFGHGALSFYDQEGGRFRLYVSSNDVPFSSPPIMRHDTSDDSLFPRVSVLPLGQFHATIEQYILSGQRPGNVGWIEVEQGDLPRLDPRW